MKKKTPSLNFQLLPARVDENFITTSKFVKFKGCDVYRSRLLRKGTRIVVVPKAVHRESETRNHNLLKSRQT